MAKIKNHKYTHLLQNIGSLLTDGHKQDFRAVDNILVKTYWKIGKRIVEHEQQGSEKTEYGSQLLKDLPRDLKLQYGKGFSKRNIYLMRLFYLRYEKFQTVAEKLTWSHYSELLSISDNLSRSFYEKQCIHENWSIRELKRQRQTGLFERIALSKDKSGILELSQKGQLIESASDVVKDPYVFEFLRMPEQERYSERDLEKRLKEVGNE